MTKFNNGVVYVKKISPETVLDDYSWLIDKAKLNDNFEKDITTFLKVNISWDRYYPGCSSAPWQIEGIADKLLQNVICPIGISEVLGKKPPQVALSIASQLSNWTLN